MPIPNHARRAPYWRLRHHFYAGYELLCEIHAISGDHSSGEKAEPGVTWQYVSGYVYLTNQPLRAGSSRTTMIQRRRDNRDFCCTQPFCTERKLLMGSIAIVRDTGLGHICAASTYLLLLMTGVTPVSLASLHMSPRETLLARHILPVAGLPIISV